MRTSPGSTARRSGPTCTWHDGRAARPDGRPDPGNAASVPLDAPSELRSLFHNAAACGRARAVPARSAGRREVCPSGHHLPHRLPQPLRLKHLRLGPVLQHLPHEPRGIRDLERHNVAPVLLLPAVLDWAARYANTLDPFCTKPQATQEPGTD